ncbi:hypothetical protein M900_1828 [Bacteriovorax sp. Seq25_V]|nr:hypothetical protein M900_1828 [Bacteriovorax sp. Seq25_V]
MRASTLVTLFFYVILLFIRTHIVFDFEYFLALVFGASFVGMSCPNRVGFLGVFLGSIIYSGLFHFLVPMLTGFGGALGLSAFLGCVVAVCLRLYIIRK